MRTRRLSLPRLSAFAVAGAVLLAALVPLPAQAAPSSYQLSSAIPVGTQPWAVAANSKTGKVYVGNSTDDTVSVIDGTTGTVTSTIPVGDTPNSMAVNETTNKIYVVNTTDGKVSEIDGATGSVTSISAGLWAYAVAVNETTNKIYVANLSSSVSEIDGLTHAVTNIPVGVWSAQPTAIAVNETTNTIYTVDYVGSQMFEIDGLTRAVKPGITVATNPFGVAINETTNTVYATGLGSNTVAVFNGATRTVVKTIDMGAGAGPFGIQVDEGRNTVFVANGESSSVSVIDGATNMLASTVPLGAKTRAIALNTVTNTVYATRADNKLAVLSVTPAITTTSLAQATVGTAYSAMVASTGSGPITFAVTTGSLPTGLTLNTTTGVISGTPTAAGSVTFTITATNVAGSDSQEFTLNPIVAAPYISTLTLPAGQVGQAYSATIAASGSGPITFSISSGNLPAGLTLNPGTGEIMGTPASGGDATFTVRAANIALFNEKTLSITITEAPSITTESLAGATVGTAYSASVEATGTGPIAFTVSAGELPAGLSLDAATGEITGTPTAAGSAEFTITASNVAGNNAKEFTITTSLTPTITTESLAAGTVGKAYSATVDATGTSPIAFTVSAGELPAGLSLDAATGEITGTPTAAGSAKFTITATNVAGSNAKEFTITTSLTPAATTEPTPVATTSPTPVVTTKASPAAPLAKTGIDALPWLAGSGIVLLAGAMLVLLTTSRRRRSA